MSVMLAKTEEDLDRRWRDARELLRSAAPSNLLAFTRFTKRDFSVNWHHRVAASALEMFVRREIPNLMLFMPPRVGKTELASKRTPAWAMGIQPNLNIIATSYAADLAAKNNRAVQRIIDTQEYRDVFPLTTLAGKDAAADVPGTWMRNNSGFEVVGHRGVYRSTGVGGGITGQGGDLIFIDDPIKNMQEALSETRRKSIYEWYQSTLYSRRESGAGICLIMTRWHEEDLAGKILLEEPGEWEVVSFPMIHEGPAPLSYNVSEHFSRMDKRRAGDPLWPAKYDELECMKIKKAVGSRSWTGLYQQRPAPAEGNIVKREHFSRRWRALPAKFDEMIISVDCSFKKTTDSDYVAMGVWGRIGAEKYLCDQVREKLGFVATTDALRDLSARWPKAVAKIIEEKANGAAVIDYLKKEVPGLIPYNPDKDGSKEARFVAVSPEIEAGNVILPDPSVAPWIADYVNELVSFPNAAHDDQVDQTSMALLRFRSKKNYLAMLTKM